MNVCVCVCVFVCVCVCVCVWRAFYLYVYVFICQCDYNGNVVGKYPANDVKPDQFVVATMRIFRPIQSCIIVC